MLLFKVIRSLRTLPRGSVPVQLSPLARAPGRQSESSGRRKNSISGGIWGISAPSLPPLYPTLSNTWGSPNSRCMAKVPLPGPLSPYTCQGKESLQTFLLAVIIGSRFFSQPDCALPTSKSRSSFYPQNLDQNLARGKDFAGGDGMLAGGLVWVRPFTFCMTFIKSFHRSEF